MDSRIKFVLKILPPPLILIPVLASHLSFQLWHSQHPNYDSRKGLGLMGALVGRRSGGGPGRARGSANVACRSRIANNELGSTLGRRLQPLLPQFVLAWPATRARGRGVLGQDRRAVAGGYSLPLPRQCQPRWGIRNDYGLLITDAPPPASSSTGLGPWNAYLDSRGGAWTAAGNKKLSQTKQLALVRWLDSFLSNQLVLFFVQSQDSIDFNSLIPSNPVADCWDILLTCIYRLLACVRRPKGLIIQRISIS